MTVAPHGTPRSVARGPPRLRKPGGEIEVAIRLGSRALGGRSRLMCATDRSHVRPYQGPVHLVDRHQDGRIMVIGRLDPGIGDGGREIVTAP